MTTGQISARTELTPKGDSLRGRPAGGAGSRSVDRAGRTGMGVLVGTWGGVGAGRMSGATLCLARSEDSRRATTSTPVNEPARLRAATTPTRAVLHRQLA